MHRIAFGVCAVLAFASAAAAGETAQPAAKPSAAFERIKGLAGVWRGSATHGSQTPEPAEVRYDVTSGGTAVVETLFPSTPHEMVSVYHDQGGKLMMTHYCMMGNQPVLQLESADAHHVSLALAGEQGIASAQEPHMHALTIEWGGPNQVKQTWTGHAGGQPTDTTVLELTRSE